MRFRDSPTFELALTISLLAGAGCVFLAPQSLSNHWATNYIRPYQTELWLASSSLSFAVWLYQLARDRDLSIGTVFGFAVLSIVFGPLYVFLLLLVLMVAVPAIILFPFAYLVSFIINSAIEHIRSELLAKKQPISAASKKNVDRKDPLDIIPVSVSPTTQAVSAPTSIRKQTSSCESGLLANPAAGAALTRIQVIDLDADDASTSIEDNRRVNIYGSNPVSPARRAEIEEAAIDFVFNFYRSKTSQILNIVSVESQNRGWDLEATDLFGKKLLIEVKGVSSSWPSIEITPNEYAMMNRREIRDIYELFVVTEPTTDRAKGYRFRFSSIKFNRGRWFDEHEKIELDLTERIAARGRLKRSSH